MYTDEVLLDDLDDELDLSKNYYCRSFLHSNGYTNVSICNCKYGSNNHVE